ncbi:hypothetical protein ACP275_01G056500 [Erythranthe tilingii]
MSGTASTSVAVGVGMGGGGEMGYGGYKPPFTAVQWQELEHQAMIYKYLVAGLPVPPDLVMPIRRSFDALSARFFHHPSLGYCSYYGKKFDPEPGRCRRTDGKKWRCSKDAHPDSKYCERHMHRGRNRSRKPVESHSSTPSSSTSSQSSLSTAMMSHLSSGGGGGGGGSSGIFQGGGGRGGGGTFRSVPVYSGVGSEGLSFGSSVAKLQMEPISYGMDDKEFRYMHGLTPDADDSSFSPEASGSLGLGSNAGTAATWHLMPSSSSLLKQKSDSQLLFGHQNNSHAFESISQRQQEQQQQHPVHPFFSEWPTTKESWSTLEDQDGSHKNILFSSTQLSMSIPRASLDFSTRSAYSPNDA